MTVPVPKTDDDLDALEALESEEKEFTKVRFLL
jgi:hypothetical protein